MDPKSLGATNSRGRPNWPLSECAAAMRDKPQGIEEIALSRAVRTDEEHQWAQVDLTGCDTFIVPYRDPPDERGSRPTLYFGLQCRIHRCLM